MAILDKGDIEGCKFCTRVDQRGDRIRVRPCGSGCHAVYEAQITSPLTRFLAKLGSYTDQQLREASVAKAAKHYGIRKDWAASYIGMERMTRGIRT